MFESDTRAASVIIDAIRTLFSWLDRVAYALLEFVYQLFFNVASADLFSNDTIQKFYGRVQLILGVYMMFQLAMTILRGIVNPDSFTGGKDGGGGAKLISRIAVALLMLAFLTPINIPSPQNEYEEQLKSNGILFGTLYSLQHRILANNTLGRLILGNDDSSTTYFDDNGQEDLSKSSRIFASTILRGFYRINLLDESDRPEHEDGKDDAIFNDNRVCQDIDDDILNTYTRLDANPGDIIGMINMTCEADDAHLGVFRSIVSVFSKKLAGKEKYMFTFMPLISTVTGLVFAIILLSFSIDIAVRAVKLAVLRLIAPIPLISYMDPKGSKDGAFNSWVKTLTSTYLDLFIRLAVIYFVIFLIQDMIVNGVVMSHGEGIVGKLSLIIIWIGLFVFAKQAPKFIKSVLGIKGEDGKLFSGFGEALALGAVGGGIVGGAISRGVAHSQAHAGEKGNLGKSIVAGFAGGIGGGFNAGKAYLGAKSGDSKAVANANRAYNARNYSNAADDSTFKGRMIAGMQGAVGMKNQLQKMDDKIKYYGAAESAMKRIGNAFDNNGDYKVKFDSAFANKLSATGASKGFSYQFDSSGNLTDRSGNVILKNGQSYSLKAFNDMISRVSASSDVDMRDAVDEAKKQAQGMRFNEIRSFGSSDADRARLVAMVNDASNKDWTENDLIAYDAARTIFNVGEKYSSEAVFDNLRGKDFSDASVSWGQYKGAASGAARKADQLKNSNEYAQAKSNAARAEQAKKQN